MTQPTTKHAIAKILAEATITHTAQFEDLDPDDSFAYTDPAEQRATVEAVRAAARASEWGWCCVKTTITWQGYTTTTYLGACSYESEADFVRCEGPTQAHEVAQQLLHEIQQSVERAEVAARAARRTLKTLGL